MYGNLLNNKNFTAIGLDIFFEKHSEIGYFRKVNFLVAYFEDLGFDVDNQVPFYIEKDHIIALIDRCKTVLDDHSKAPEELPTCKGFFFGSTEYDEGYFYDVEMVLRYCENTLLPMFDELADSEGIYFATWY